MSLGWPEQLHERTQQVKDLREQVITLTARLKEETEDTARLDWLIDSSNHAENGWLSDEAWDNLPGDSEDPRAEVRAAIDAARRGEAVSNTANITTGGSCWCGEPLGHPGGCRYAGHPPTGNITDSRDATIASLTARIVELEDKLKRQHLGHLQWLDAGEKAGFVFSTGKDGFAMEYNPELNLTLRGMAENEEIEIADLTAQLSAMTQERDAHGAEREEVEKRLMDCQYRLAEVTAKLAEARDEVCPTCADGTMYERANTAETELAAKSAQLNDLLNDVVDVAQAEMRAVTAETALREAREDTKRLDWMENYFGLRISATTENGKIVKHIEADAGSAMYAQGNSLRTAIDAALSAAPQTEAPQGGRSDGHG